eukprot:271593_1
MNNNNNLHSDSNHDQDSNHDEDMSNPSDHTDPSNQLRHTRRVTIITVSTNRITNKQEQDDDELCRCGDPNSHKDECSLYCGLAPCHDKLVKFPKCSHYIHETCLEQLLCTRMSKCPLCRSSIDSWRRSCHYQQIEEEISNRFQSDTEQAILLSQKMYDQEQRKQKAAKRESRSGTRDRDESEGRNRERSRSRERDNSNRREGRERSSHHRDHHRERYERHSNTRNRSWNNRNNRNNRRYS